MMETSKQLIQFSINQSEILSTAKLQTKFFEKSLLKKQTFIR